MQIRPNALCLYNLSRHAPHNNHFHQSNGKQYCMLRQYIAGGYTNPPLPVVWEINQYKHDATSIVSDHSPPLEGWQAQPDGVVASCLHQYSVGPFPSCGGRMTSTDTLLQSYRICTRRRSLMKWWHRVCTNQQSFIHFVYAEP